MWQIAGLPAHPLLVHAVVVLIPLAALMVIVGSVWPAARRKLGVLTPLVAAVALVFVPLAKEAGEALERQVPGSAALDVHTELGDQLFPWAIGLFVVAAGQRVWFRMRARKPSGDTRSTAARVSTIAIAVVAIGVSVGTTVSVVQVGDSGARAVWSGQSGTSSTEK